jgi:hypothetical protein
MRVVDVRITAVDARLELRDKSVDGLAGFLQLVCHDAERRTATTVHVNP